MVMTLLFGPTQARLLYNVNGLIWKDPITIELEENDKHNKKI
jgi:hypothetical protein